MPGSKKDHAGVPPKFAQQRRLLRLARRVEWKEKQRRKPGRGEAREEG